MPLGGSSSSFSGREFERQLHTRTLGRRVRHYDIIASTNDVAFQLALQGAEEGDVVVAEGQSAGRGRLGREWFSETGEGLYISLILRPAVSPRLTPILNLAVAVAVSRSLEKLCGLSVDIKWPNDILIQRRKCCGILTEMNADPERVRFLIAGIGINVSHRQFPPELMESATSIFLESNRHFSRESLLAVILNDFEGLYQRFLREGGKWVADLWAQRSSGAWGKRVSVDVGDRTVLGTTHGLSDIGALRVVTESGRTEEIVSGDVILWE
jgi:BirA family transcriptional regulator, biotin operon repressor / biotin---[acetyl-CoA-carboxylase] ligase